jgi:helix-turn-helix protein
MNRETAIALVDVGGRFMTGAEMAGAAKPFGMPAGGLYFRGRGGALGAVSASVATSAIGIFPSWVIELTWRDSAALPTHVAVGAYVRACEQWGHNHLTHVAGLARLAELAERVVDRADTSALPLFAAWRARPRPEDVPARAAFALMLLRELRGGLHFAALHSAGLDIPLAVVGDPRGGEARLRRTAWRDDEITALLARAAATPQLAQRWAAAEATTNAAFDQQLAELPEHEQAELTELIHASDKASARSVGP